MESKNLLLAFDIGTTVLKAAIMNLERIRVISKATAKARIDFPKEGWAEINPSELWRDLVSLSRKLFEDKPDAPKKIKGVIFSPHMAGVVPVDEEGNPLRNMIIWLDERAAGYPKDIWRGIIKVEGYNLFKLIRFLRITGGAPSKTGKDPISKILWIRDNEPDIYNKTHKILDIKGYLINKVSGEMVTSHDEATLTWLVDTRRNVAVWHDGLLRAYGISKDLLPRILDSTEIAGFSNKEASEDLGIPKEIPVLVGAGDLTTAAVGSGAVKEGEPHVYIGTSDWVGAHISRRKVDIFHYIGSILSAIPRKYLLVAEQEIAGGALDWVMEITGVRDYAQVNEELAKGIDGEQKIIFLPWMYGERCPIDDPHVRGSFINLTVRTEKMDLIRAVVVGVTLNIKWAYHYFEKIVGEKKEVSAVGGGCRLDSWCQHLANATNRVIKKVEEPENTTLKGATMIASVGLKVHKTFEDAAENIRIAGFFKPDKEQVEIYNKLLKEFEKLYKSLRGAYRRLNPT